MKKVVPGQRFSIGANDWNQIADVINHRNIGDQTGHASKPAGWVMAVVNYVAFKFSPYAVTGALEAWNTSALNSSNVGTDSDITNPALKASITKPVNANVVYPEFVIMQENTAANEGGWAILSGITPALVKIKMAQHNYCYYNDVSPFMSGTSRTFLTSSFEGNAKIIWRPSTITADGIYWCLIEIGAVSGEDYIGQFKALIDNDKIVICDGANPASSIAGSIKSPNLSVAKTEFSITAGKIFLEVIYNDSTKVYSTSFYQGSSITGSINYGNPRMWYTEIAEYTSGGQLIQLHKTGAIEILGRWL